MDLTDQSAYTDRVTSTVTHKNHSDLTKLANQRDCSIAELIRVALYNTYRI